MLEVPAARARKHGTGNAGGAMEILRVDADMPIGAGGGGRSGRLAERARPSTIALRARDLCTCGGPPGFREGNHPRLHPLLGKTMRLRSFSRRSALNMWLTASAVGFSLDPAGSLLGPSARRLAIVTALGHGPAGRSRPRAPTTRR